MGRSIFLRTIGAPLLAVLLAAPASGWVQTVAKTLDVSPLIGDWKNTEVRPVTFTSMRIMSSNNLVTIGVSVGPSGDVSKEFQAIAYEGLAPTDPKGAAVAIVARSEAPGANRLLVVQRADDSHVTLTMFTSFPAQNAIRSPYVVRESFLRVSRRVLLEIPSRAK